MEHMKKYEYFMDGIFRRGKKLPEEVTQLGEVLSEFINSNTPPEWLVDTIEHHPKDKKHTDNISLYIIENSLVGTRDKFIGLYYNPRTDLVQFIILPKEKQELINIQDFLEKILTPFNTQSKEFQNELIEGRRFWIKLNNIISITKSITDQNLDKFLNK